MTTMSAWAGSAAAGGGGGAEKASADGYDVRHESPKPKGGSLNPPLIGGGSAAAGISLPSGGVDEITETLGEVRLESATSKSKPVKSKRYHTRLILGEADFSYTVALIEKHPDIAKYVTATELSAEDDLKETYPSTFEKNINKLRDLEVIVEFGVDARQIHAIYAGKTFERIQFNFPHDRSSWATERSLAKLMSDFFESAHILQKDGHRIHVVIPDKILYHLWTGIYDASQLMGYGLIRKRNFTKDGLRYLGYKHHQTNSSASVEAANNGVEYVFEKGATIKKSPHVVTGRKYTKHYLVREEPLIKEGEVCHDGMKFKYFWNSSGYGFVSTDSDSSEYFSDEDE